MGSGMGSGVMVMLRVRSEDQYVRGIGWGLSPMIRSIDKKKQPRNNG
jgi:hypothetical protein